MFKKEKVIPAIAIMLLICLLGTIAVLVFSPGQNEKPPTTMEMRDQYYE